MINYGYIYRTTNLDNGMVYVGQHAKGGFDAQYLGSGLLIRRAIPKHGRDRFLVECLEFSENSEALDCAEQRSIIEHRSLLGSNRLYNITPGGSGLGSGPDHPSFGRKVSEDVKQRISEAHKGKPKSLETRRKLSLANKGFRHSAATKAKMSITHTGVKMPESHRLKLIARMANDHPMSGRKHSAESRRKISESNKGEKNKFFGRRHTEESLRKMRDSHLRVRNGFFGKHHTPEICAKISAAVKARHAARRSTLVGEGISILQALGESR